MTDALAASLRLLADAVDRGSVPQRAIRRLKSALEAAGACWHRDVAMRRLREILDPHASLSDWAAACAIAERLDAFDGSLGHQRIAAGYRKPKSESERILLDLLACPLPARSPRAIWDILRLHGAVQKPGGLLDLDQQESPP